MRARVAVGALLLQPAFGLVFAWGAVVPHALRDGWSPLLVGAVFSATPFGYGIGTILGGRLGDRLPPQRLCWASLGLLGAGFLVTFTWPSGVTFVACYGFAALGVGGGVALAGGVAALGQAFPAHRGSAAGAATATYAASAVVQIPIVSAAVAALGWKSALAAVGGAAGLIAAAALVPMPSLPAPGVRRAGPAPSIGALVRRPLVWTAFLAVFAASTFGPSAAVNVGAAAATRGLGAAIATAAVVLVAAGNAAQRLVGGWASDHLGVDRLLAAMLALELTGAILLFVRGTALSFLAGALAAGLALGGAGLVGRLAAEGAPDAPSSAFGLVFAGYTLAALSGPLVAALAGLPAGWLVVGLPALGGAAVLAVRGRLRPAGAPDGSD